MRATPGRLDRATRAFCAEQAKIVTALPFARIEQAVRPINDQKELFADLKKAAAAAAAQFRDACPDAVPLTPLGRLEAMTLRLDAALAAIKTIGPPLAAFYESLTDEQKARFNEIGPDLEREPRTASERRGELPGRQGRTRGPADRPHRSDRAADAGAGSRAHAPARRDREVGGDAERGLRRRDARHAGRAARRDAEAARGDASAAQDIRPALEEFYASLDDEQKAKFNRLSRVAAQSRN